MTYVEFRASADEILVVGMPEKVLVGKQDDAVFNRAKGAFEEDEFGKTDTAVRIRTRRWQQYCQT